jgi:hypothetical protein
MLRSRISARSRTRTESLRPEPAAGPHCSGRRFCRPGDGELMPDRYPLGKQPQTAVRHRRPALVVGQRDSGNDRDAIIGGRDIAEIDTQILIAQVRNGKRCLADDIAELGGTVGKQTVAIRQQIVARAARAEIKGELMERVEQPGLTRWPAAKALTQVLQQPAKSAFAVGLADRVKLPSSGGVKSDRLPLWAKIQ